MDYKISKNVTSVKLHKCGFRYDGEKYCTQFPIHWYRSKHGNIPVIFLRVSIRLDEKQLVYSVVDNNGMFYATYYNAYRFGGSDLMYKKLNRNINNVLNRLCDNDVIVCNKPKSKSKSKSKSKNTKNKKLTVREKKKL